jgi:hypothetical protein
MKEAIRIDGRDFEGVSQELSAAQDDYIIGQLRLAGALEILAAPQTHAPNGLSSRPQARSAAVEGPAVSAEALAEALLTQILISGRAAQVLAGCLTESGKKWSAPEADRNAAIFSAITDPTQKLAMREALIGFVTGFFLFATASAKTSPKSSSRS